MRTPETISARSIAGCLGLTERAVRTRAGREGWPCVYSRARGGSCRSFLVAMLPEEVRSAVVKAVRPAGVAGAGFDGAQAAVSARVNGLAAFNMLPEARRREAEARFEILQARDAFITVAGLPKKKGSELFARTCKAGGVELPAWVLETACTRKGKVALSWASLHRWEKAYREGGLAGLAGGYAPVRKTAIPKAQRQVIQALLVEFPHISIPNIRQSLGARFAGEKIPSESSLRRYVKRWKSEHVAELVKIADPDTFKNRFQVALGDASEHITRVNQLWEFDSTPGDVMLTDGRHNLIGVVDVACRRAKLLVSKTSKATAVAALTRAAILGWGAPEGVKTDNGADYVSRHMQQVFHGLEVDWHLCPPFSPEKKPHIERFFETFSHSIVELLPGYIGHSVADRKAIEARRSFAQRLMSQGSDPVEVGMSSAEFQTLCNRWCEAVYHQKAHSSLKGKSPAQVAREDRTPIRRIPDERALDLLLSKPAAGDGTRVVKKRGLDVEGAVFIAPELGAMVGERVKVLLDAADWGTVYVFRLSGEFACRAVCPDRTGHDRVEIAAKARAIQKRVMKEGVAELRKVAREASVREISQEIIGHYEAEMATVTEFPKASEPYTTPALEEAARAVASIEREQLGPRPFGITEAEEKSSQAVIDLAEAKKRPLPANDQEKYEMLLADFQGGVDMDDAELAWMKRYEAWLFTGERLETN